MVNNTIMVSIRCITYNHASYIRQCLDGFVMQKTNFRFQAIVHDDASTDGTTEIVREYAEKYPDIIIPMYEEENRWSKHDGSLFAIMLPLMKGKYWAECEGDDYWTDPLKLQKQVDILENNPNVMMVYTAFDTVDEQNRRLCIKKYQDYINFSRSGDVFSRLLWRNHILTLTICFRREIIDSDIYKDAPSKLDYLYFLTAAAKGDCYFIKEVTGCYRITSTGAVATRSDEIYKRLWDLYEYFFQLYINNKTKNISGLRNKWVLNCTLLCNTLRNRQLLMKTLKKRPCMLLFLFPAAIMKIIDYFGIRRIPIYNEYCFFNMISGQ